MTEKKQEKEFPPKKQERQPGRRSEMDPAPSTGENTYRGCGKLEGKVAVITGGTAA